MMNKIYILIHPDEDGNCADFLNQKDLDDLLDNPIDERGVRHFISGAELEEKEENDLDPQNWDEGDALLLEYTVLEVKPVVTKYEVRKK